MSYVTQTGRILWKEYRSLRAIWFLVLFFGLLLQGMMYMTITNNTGLRNNSIKILALLIPICFAVASALQMFSGEKNDRTFNYLLFLPIRPSVLLIGKILFGAILSIIIACPMFLLSEYLCGELAGYKTGSFSSIPNTLQYLRSPDMGFFWFVLLPISLYGTSIFCSLISSSAQKAILALATLTFIDFIILSAKYPLAIIGIQISSDTLNAFFVLVSAPIVVFGTLLLLRPWLRRLSPLNNLLPQFEVSVNLPSRKKTKVQFSKTEYFQDPLQRSIYRLFWKEWKTVRWFAGLCFSALILLLILPAFFQGMANRHPGFLQINQRNGFIDFLTYTGFGICYAVICFYPLLMFQGEHQNKRFLFISERGISPGMYWLGKQIFWLIPFFLSAFIVFTFYFFGNPDDLSLFNWRSNPSIFVILTQLLITFSFCQFVSFHNSKLYVSILVTVLGVIAIMGTSTFLYQWNIPTYLVFLPISLLLLLITFLRMRYWLIEQNRWKSWKWSTIATAVILLSTYYSVLHYRVAEIPILGNINEHLTDQGGRSFDGIIFSSNLITADFSRFNESQKTGQEYRSLIDQLSPCPADFLSYTKTNEERAYDYTGKKTITTLPDIWAMWTKQSPALLEWYKNNQTLIPQIIEISKRDSCLFFNYQEPPKWAEQYPDLNNIKSLLLLNAKKLESENKLTEARDIYLTVFRINNHLYKLHGTFGLDSRGIYQHYMTIRSWINHPSQTPELLKESYELFKTTFVPDQRKKYIIAGDRKKYLRKNHTFDLTYVAYVNSFIEVANLNRTLNKSGDEVSNPIPRFLWNMTSEKERKLRLIQNNMLIKFSIINNLNTNTAFPKEQPESYTGYLNKWLNNSVNSRIYREQANNNEHTYVPINKRYEFPFFLKEMMEIECYQEEILTRIALKQFELEKERSAESLEELVTERYLKEVPKLSYLDIPFDYYRHAVIMNSEIYREGKFNIDEYHPKPFLHYRHRNGETVVLLKEAKNSEGINIQILSRASYNEHWMHSDFAEGMLHAMPNY